MGLRPVLGVKNGAVSPDTWLGAAREEPRCRGKARACEGCPLRIGGEWEPGATAALAEMTEPQRGTMQRWGCHAEDRPCAGMRRLLSNLSRKTP